MVQPGWKERSVAPQPTPQLQSVPGSRALRDVGKSSGAVRNSRRRVSSQRASPIPPGLAQNSTRGATLRTTPQFQKSDSNEGLVDWPGGKFSLETFDAALESREVEECWKQVLRLKRELEDGDVPHTNIHHNLDFRSGQLVLDAPGPGPSSCKADNDSNGNHSELVYSDGSDFLYGSTNEFHTCQPCEPQYSIQSCAQQSHRILEILGKRHKKFIQACLRAHRRDIALDYVRLLPAQAKIFSLLMKECLDLRDSNGLFEVLALREEMGLRPDQYSYSASISAHGRLGNVTEARLAFNRAVEEGIRSMYVYNSMVDAYSRNKDINGATEIWDALHEDGLKPDSVTYTGMIRGLGAVQRIEDMKKLFKEMLELGLRPMPHTFTVIYDAAAECEEQDGTWLMSLCDIMARNDIVINRHILSALITSLCQARLEVGQIDELFTVVEDFRSSAGSPGAMVYCSLLSFCGRHGIPERVIDVWKAMQEDGVRPNCHIYSAALTSCSTGSQGDTLLSNFASSIGTQLQQDWKSSEEGLAGSMLIAFNSLVNACTSLGDMEQALEIFSTMEQSGPDPDSITYNTLMGGFASLGQLKEALAFMDRMHAAELEVTARSYVALLTACAKANNVDIAKNLFKEMLESGIPASVEAYTALMDACVKDGSQDSLDLAFKLRTDMEREGVSPTAVTYGCLLVACQRKGDVDLAFNMYRQAHGEGILPSDECHNILINMCTLACRLDEALDLIKVMAWQHGSIEHHTLNSLVRALARHYVERAIVVMRLMRNRKVEPTKETYHAVIMACTRHARASTAFELYKQMRSKGIKGSREVGSAVMASVCQASEFAVAFRVAEDMMTCAGMPSLKHELQSTLPAEKLRKISKAGGIGDHSQLPDARAWGWLCRGLVRSGKHTWAMRIFRIAIALEGNVGVMKLVENMEGLFECLIESNCRNNDVEQALEVFDVWKAAAVMVMARNRSQKGEEIAYKTHPRLSQASLAFLEATCKRHPELQWRLYDVCASMRQQREWDHEATLPRPPQPSHHFQDVA